MTDLERRKPSYVSTLLREKYDWAAPDIYLGDKLWSKFTTLRGRPHVMDDYWCAAVAHYDALDDAQGSHSGMTRRGDSGELAAIRINRARRNSKARQALILAGIVRPKAQSGTNDASSAYAKQLAELLIDYDLKAGGLDALWAKWTEWSEVLGDAYTFTRWNPWAGEQIGMMDGRPVNEGALETTVLPPWLREFDESYPTADKTPWEFVSTYEPKTDLLLAYTKLLDGRSGDQAADAIWGCSGDDRLNRMGVDHDTAHVVTAIHYPCAAIPLGLYVRMLGADIVLERRPYIGEGGDYDAKGPRAVLRLASDEMIDAPYSHAAFQSQIAPQELSDAMLTQHATSITQYSDPLYAISNQADEQPSKLSAGPGRVWRMGLDGKKPELVQRPEISESAMEFDDKIAGEMERDMALNDAVTGQTEGSEKNAQAEALRASQAVQQVAPAAKGARRALMQLCELRIKTLRKNAKGDRLLKLVGQAKKHLLARETYQGAELEAFDTVELEEGNPMEATPQGRWELTRLLKDLQLLKSQEDVLTALATGRIEPAIDPLLDENLLIKSENDALRRGEVPPVEVMDNNILHMRSHDCVMMNPAARQDGKLSAAHNAHWNAHYEAEFGISPLLDPMEPARRKYIAGLGPPPMPGMPPGAPPPDGGAPAMPPNGPAAVKPPTNPQTGTEFSNVPPQMGAA